MCKKEMQYGYVKKYEILFSGSYEGYNFYITSMCGRYPCAYVEIKEHVDYQELEDEIDCHWGLTYSGNLNHILGNNNRWFIGWDYGHYGDYVGGSPANFEDDKKWTTDEIYEEVKEVIKQLKENNYEP